ncbi:hypothetical protein ElyMa_002031400 [Elysia marginata]|uniref:Uncharacterized protein n=1 Tax=Elysia marginata TaxID=1093978 RepID=A0AAV4F7T6_9GAST|nr:hypothetical protein ElyMa_002031400 [Elysia marginata]
MSCSKQQRLKEIIPRNKDNYHIIVKTDREPSLNNEPLKARALNDSASGVTDFVSCERNSSKWLHGNMIRKGKMKTAAVSCPPTLIGSFSVTFMIKAEASKCPQGAVMTSSAAPNSPFVIDYSHCKQKSKSDEERRGKETFWCIAKTGAGISVYQEGDDMSYFSCVTVGSDPLNREQTIYMQRPGGCGDSWYTGSDLPRDSQSHFRIAFLKHVFNNHQGKPVSDAAFPFLLTQNAKPMALTGGESRNLNITISKLDKSEKKADVTGKSNATEKGSQTDFVASDNANGTESAKIHDEPREPTTQRWNSSEARGNVSNLTELPAGEPNGKHVIIVLSIMFC